MSSQTRQAWSILRTHTTEIPPGIGASGIPGRPYQLLEVLVTLIVQKIQPDYSWTVTPVSKDRGVDLIGERALFDIPDIRLHAVSAIIGQCKTAGGKSKPDLVREFAPAMARMTEALREQNRPRPTLIVLAALADVGTKHLESALRILRLQADAPIIYLGKDELLRLFRDNIDLLSGYLREVLAPADLRAVLDYISSSTTAYDPAFSVKVATPEYSETGTALTVQVEVSTSRFIPRINIQWVWPTPPAFVLVKPLAVEREGGFDLNTSRPGPHIVTLRFLCYRPGEHDLGAVVLKAGHDQRPVEIPLGQLTVANAYHPPYFEGSTSNYLQAFESSLDKVLSGEFRLILITGAGGLGKTRLANHCALRAEQRDVNTISLMHPTTGDSPYSLLLDLVHHLLPSPVEPGELFKNLGQHFERRAPIIAQEDLPQLEPLLSGSPGSTRSAPHSPGYGDSFLRIILALLLERVAEVPLLLHISNLHWASHELLSLFYELAEHLRLYSHRAALKSLPRPRILLAFEGRVMERQRETGVSIGDSYSTARWEVLLNRLLAFGEALHLPLRPLSEKETRAFVESLFESLQSPDRHIPLELVPSRELLLNTIVHCAAGNPLYVVEYIRLLLADGTLYRHEKSGLLCLTKAPKDGIEPPATVSSLIESRFAYFKEHHGRAASVVQAAAFLRDSIPFGLLEDLLRELAPDVSIQELSALEFLALPVNKTGDVRFRHEYHFELVSRLSFDDEHRASVVRAYSNWLDQRPSGDLDVLFDRGLLALRARPHDAGEVRRLFEVVLERAKERQRTHLAIRAAQHLVETYGSSPLTNTGIGDFEICQIAGYLYSAGRLLTLAANWAEARAYLTRLLALLEEVLSGNSLQVSVDSRHELLVLLNRAQVQVANVDIHLLHHGRARKTLSSVLSHTGGLLAHHGSPRVATQPEIQAIYFEALDRLGIATWFDGEAEEAAVVLRGAWRQAKKLDEQFWRVMFLIDLGAVMSHVRPRRASAILKRALDLLGTTVDSPKDVLLATLHLVVAELSILGEEDLEHQSRSRRHVVTAAGEAEGAHFRAQSLGYAHEESKAALLAGSCLAALGEERCIDWLMRALRLAQRHEHLGHLWKAHVNLAQFLVAQSDIYLRRGYDLHAHLAEEIVFRDLKQRDEPSRLSRLKVYHDVLTQLYRIWELSGKDDLQRFSARCRGLDEHLASRLARNDHGSTERKGRAIYLQSGPSLYFISG